MSDTGDAVVRIQGVSHHYGQVAALKSVALEIPAGKMVGLIGPDGVGKSTLMGLIAGARKIQSGQVWVLGGELGDPNHLRAVCPQIAYMPQGLGKNLYFELSVFENIDFFARLFDQPRAERERRINGLLKATGLAPFPDRPVGKLSGGMKQKVGLCSALVHDPDLLLLDEPTTGVDPLSRRQFWTLIDSIRQQRPQMSVLVSTAYMDEAEQFDWIIAMNDGEILASDAPRNLLEKTGSANLEEAFVKLLPPERRGDGQGLHIPPRQPSTEGPAIIAREVTMKFGSFTAVNNVSFEIERGEIFGFLGSNGCGKTTTMKILTGLLPATHGEALLFGQKVNANDLATRRRVGYMSQAFSLYAELTVAQNLWLHARLFELPEAEAAQRIDELVQRFGLQEEYHSLAASLPLGVRQRLSLAVAVIHRPEMLILDEPTSGVDPVARDEFWKLLVELSRNEQVTIFVSTHFMNEALRCDRISLMHAGTVLACDTPQKLVEQSGQKTLEEAFIRQIEQAIPPGNDPTPEDLAQVSGGPTAAAHRPPRGFSLARLRAYAHREVLEIQRDPVRLAFAFLGSALLMLVLGFGITMDVENIRFSYLDLDQTPASRELIAAYQGSRYFREVSPPLQSANEALVRLQGNDISVALEIPKDYGRDFQTGRQPEVAATIDGANPFRSETMRDYVSSLLNVYLEDQGRQQTVAEKSRRYTLPIKLQPRFRYNPTFDSVYAMVPSVPAMLLILIPATLMAVSVVREKELGSISNFYTTPTTRIEFLVGKQLPYVAIGMLNFTILTIIALLVFDIPLKGSLPTLVLSSLLYVWATTGIGLLISTLTSSQVAAVFVTTVVTMLPTIQFSGLLQPVSTQEGSARVIGLLWPTTYYMHTSVGVYTKGLLFADLATDLLALAVFGPVLVLLTCGLLKKQEA
jgi:ribosome-dependent ATPase